MNATDTTRRTRWLALYALCLGDLMIVLDTNIVNVALPSIQSDLSFSSETLAWVVNAYMLTFGGFLLLSGRLGDLYGNRRVLLGGVAAFTVASVACAFAPTAAFLVVGRAVSWDTCEPSAATNAVERVTGIEPAWPAWKAGALPLSYTREVPGQPNGRRRRGPQLPAVSTATVLGVTQTLPLYVEDRFVALDLTGAFAAGLLLGLVAVAVLLVMTRLGRRLDRSADVFQQEVP